MGWFDVLMTEFILCYCGRKDGVDLVLIYCHVGVFVTRFGQEKEIILHQNKVYPCNVHWNVHGNK